MIFPCWSISYGVILAEFTGPTLASLTFHLLANPSCLAKLKTELAEAMPDPNSLPTCATVENLPYLSAVVQETLRLHPPASFRSQRVSPDEPVVYRSRDGEVEWRIPPGTPMSMSIYLIHMDPAIFQNPYEWRPERWIEDPRLDRYLLAFSRGSRMCLGYDVFPPPFPSFFSSLGELTQRAGSTLPTKKCIYSLRPSFVNSTCTIRTWLIVKGRHCLYTIRFARGMLIWMPIWQLRLRS